MDARHNGKPVPSLPHIDMTVAILREHGVEVDDSEANRWAVAPGVVVAYERNVETNARLEAAGIEVLRISGSELGSGRGGPRCMSCPMNREPLNG